MEATLKYMKILGMCRANCPRRQSMSQNQEDPSPSLPLNETQHYADTQCFW